MRVSLAMEAVATSTADDVAPKTAKRRRGDERSQAVKRARGVEGAIRISTDGENVCNARGGARWRLLLRRAAVRGTWKDALVNANHRGLACFAMASLPNKPFRRQRREVHRELLHSSFVGWVLVRRRSACGRWRSKPCRSVSKDVGHDATFLQAKHFDEKSF